ncbi:MAG: thiol reductant ABC exporter subunit CydD [Acidimicrobiales bacterium]
MSPSRAGRPHLVPPELAGRVPTIRSATAGALVIGALIAVSIVVQAVALATAIDRSILHHSALAAVRPELITVALAVLARAGLTLLGEHLARRSAESVVAVLRGQLLRQVLSLGPAWLAGERPGELSLTATRGLRSLHTYFARYLPQAAMAAVVPCVLLIWVATQDWLSLVVVVALVIAVPVTMIYFGREANRRTARQWRRLGSLAGRFLQLIEGLPTLRAFGRDGYGRREVIESTEGVRVATMRTLRVAFLSALAMDVIAGFGVGLVAMVLGLRLLWGELSLHTALAVLLVAPEIFIPLRRAGAEFHASTEGQAAATRVLEVLALAADGPAASGGPAGSGPAPPRLPRHPVDLRIDGLRVEYDDRAAPALTAFTLHAPPGSRIALVGPSGAGKSSVFDALLGFAPRAAGTMTVDARESSGVPAREWRAYFSWVPQRPYLFTASMAENLRLGAGAATDEALLAVCEVVGLDGLVAHLPRGLETPLGQDGLTLSAGERQRVALARALLCPAPILLLDEPTASLDPPAVIRIAGAIEPWLAGRTVIVAAHEPLLLPHFDVVCEVAASPLTAVTP